MKNIYFVLVFLFLASVIFPACPTGYTDEMSVIYDSNITANITNIAIPIDINTSYTGNFSANCSNILFQNNFRNETLKYSIDSNSSAYCGNASKNATYWVLMPILYNSTGWSDSINNTIFVCMGNTGVYTEDKSMWADVNASSVFHKIIGEPAYGNFSLNSRGAGGSINKTACIKLGDCNEFPATSTNYDLYNDTYLMNWNESFTISMWINMSGFSTNSHTVFYEQYGNTVNDTNQRVIFAYFGTTNTIYFFKKTDIIGGNSIQRIQHQTTPIQGTGWFHLTGVYGGGNENDIMIYLNSTASSNSPALSSYGDSATGYTMIGDDMQSGDTDYLLNGQITELQIYHGNKSQNYIKTMYAGHVSSYGSVTTSSSDTSAPIVTSIDISPLTPNPSSTLQCNITSLDNESSPMDIYINWFLNGANQTAYARSAGITNNTASLINLSLNTSITGVGDNWSCGAYGMAGTNASAIVYSLNVTIASAPPNAPTIYSPINTLYNITSLVIINYSNATTVYPLQQVGISLYKADGTFVKNLSQNNSDYLNLTFDTGNETAGVYYIKINATDNQSITNESFSPVFLLYAFNESHTLYSTDFMLANNSYHFNKTSSITSMTGSLLYDGTGQTVITNTSAIDINFTSSFYPATSALNETEYNLNWSFSFITANGTFYLNDSYTINVTPVVLAICNTSINMTTAIYSFYDEETNASINASISITYTLTSPSGATKSISLPQTTNNSVYICIYPPYAETSAVSTEIINASGYNSIVFNRPLTYYSNSSVQLINYLLTSASGTYVTITVLDSNYQPKAGVYVNISRRSPTTGQLYQVTSGLTNEIGQTVQSLHAVSVLYTFQVSEASGNVLRTFPEIAVCTTTTYGSPCVLTLVLGEATNIYGLTKMGSVSAYCSFSNTTFILTCSMNNTDKTLNLLYLNLTLQNLLNNASFSASSYGEIIVSNSLTLPANSTGGSVQIVVPNATGVYYYVFSAYFNTSSMQSMIKTLDVNYIYVNQIRNRYGTDGWFVAFLMIVGLGFVGFCIGPSVGLFLIAVGIASSVWLELLSLSDMTASALIIFLIILIWRLGQTRRE